MNAVSPTIRIDHVARRGWASAVVALLAAGFGCNVKPMPRPSVAQLMQQAINCSAKERAEQNGVAAWAGEPASSCAVDGSQFSASQRNTNEDDGDPEQEIALTAAEEEVLPAAEPIASAAEMKPAPEAALDAPQEAPGELLNEEFVEQDVREAVAILAASAGADVLMDDKVRGVVNATIENATFENALEKLLMPLGYVIGRRGEQYVVAPPDPKSPLFPFVSTQVEYLPQHLKAKDLMAAPPQQMVQFVRLVESSNKLVIEAPTQYLDMILRRLQELDQPVPQVELEAIICVVSPDSGYKFGLDWKHAVALDGNNAFELGISSLAISGKSSPKAYGHMFDDFATTSAFVKLLAQHGYLTIRASPRVMAQDGEKADIGISRETFFSTQPIATSTTGDNNAFFYQQNIQKVEAGISLVLTPRIRGEVVTVEIEKAEVSEDIRTSSDATSNPYPVINRRKVSTTVHVRDGKTIVIGGLVQRETVEQIHRIPGLSRLPGVGNLFKSVEQTSREAEVVIFISPRIIDFDCGCEEEMDVCVGPEKVQR